MAELLIELLSEEIPARMQAKAEADLLKAVGGALTDAGLSFDDSFAFSGPRRLGVVVDALMARSEDVREERKGPKLGAPEKAIAGFLRGAGLESIDQAEIRSDPKKGEFYVALIEKPGRPAADIIAEAMPGLIRGFHWPKSMRTGHGELRWVRPLQRIVCVLDGEVVPFEVDGIASGNQTEGHRVHGRGPFTVTGWADYEAQLEGEGHVLLTREARREVIAAGAAKAAKAKKLELVEDAGLLEELVGLAEWPVVLVGDMDPDFLTLPPDVIRLSMRTHQKYFALREKKTGALAPHFVVVANIEAADGGAKIAAGNAKVLSARLEDARFFWENDRKQKLGAFLPQLGAITFKEELGTLLDKTERVAALAREIAPKVGADPELAGVAAKLAKADLVSEMVYEFPELQGVMGRYYALAEAGLDPLDPSRVADAAAAKARPYSAVAAIEVADAIRDHYKPQGPADAVPTAPVSIAVALADKLDTLVGFWAIDEKPTGSKDPFALRRAALGVVRIILENGVRLGVVGEIERYLEANYEVDTKLGGLRKGREVRDLLKLQLEEQEQLFHSKKLAQHRHEMERLASALKLAQATLDSLVAEYEQLKHLHDVPSDLLAFFADRLKQVLRDQGKRHDLIDAVFALGEDDLVLIVKRVEALSDFLATEDGENLLAASKRAANILKAEEKKDNRTYEGAPDPALFESPVEQGLHSAINSARTEMDAALGDEDFEGAMAALARLRAPVDAFFDGVMVNADDAALRENRLLILAAIRDALHTVADFSKIEG